MRPAAPCHSPDAPVYIKMTQPRRRSAPTTDQSRKYSTSTTFNITVLISGSGSNLQALIDACSRSSALPNARVSHVISNRKDAYGLERAQKAHIPTTYHNLVQYKNRQPKTESGVKAAREQYDVDLAQKILTHIPCPDLVVCAGWMHILAGPFIDALKSANVPIINLHPALPGQFSGANAIGRAWDAFQKGEISGTGVMIHHVINEVDMGKPIVVKEVECKAGESESELEARIHKVEWKAIVEGTAAVLKQLEEKRKTEA